MLIIMCLKKHKITNRINFKSSTALCVFICIYFNMIISKNNTKTGPRSLR